MQTYRYFLNRNKNGNGFSELLNGKIFVDKTGLIEEIHEKISSKDKWGWKNYGFRNAGGLLYKRNPHRTAFSASERSKGKNF